MSDEALYETGMGIREELWKDGARDRLQIYTEVDPGFADLTVEIPFGMVWSRPGLDKRTRALCALAMLTVLNRPAQIRAYVDACLNLGVPKQEIIEVITQAIVYGGMPVAIEALKIAREVFKERGV